jgi:hypothetical protein
MDGKARRFALFHPFGLAFASTALSLSLMSAAVQFDDDLRHRAPLNGTSGGDSSSALLTMRLSP